MSNLELKTKLVGYPFDCPCDVLIADGYRHYQDKFMDEDEIRWFIPVLIAVGVELCESISAHINR
jgi:hypothetical protein